MVLSDDRDRFAIAFGHNAYFGIVARGMERHTLAHLEALHLLVQPCLLQIPQPSHDLVVEFRELRLTEFRDVDVHGPRFCVALRRLPTVRQQLIDAAIQMGRQPS